MGRLVYSMLQSLDGYTEDAHGDFSWGMPDDAVHAYINELATSVGAYLYGRKMYETMVFWETALDLPELPEVQKAWARTWKDAEKVVFSRTLSEPKSSRTRLEHAFDPDLVRRLKEDTERDLTVNGPSLAALAIRAGLVDEYQLILCPVILGGGKRFFPTDVRLDLTLVDERRFDGGVVVLRYVPRR